MAKKIKLRLSAFADYPGRKQTADSEEYFELYIDPEERLKSIEYTADQWMKEAPDEVIAGEINTLFGFIKEARSNISVANVNALAVNMYFIGETVGRLNHLEGWRSDIDHSRGQSRRGQGSPYPEDLKEAVVDYGKFLLQTGYEAHDITGMISLRFKRPSKPTIRGWLREEAIIPPVKKGK